MIVLGTEAIGGVTIKIGAAGDNWRREWRVQVE